MKIKTRVKNKVNGKFGTVVNDFMSCCSHNEVPVVYDYEEGFLGTDHNDLEEIGPENAIPNPDRCGIGKGENCCRFLVIDGQNGFTCERHGSLRYSLIFKDMNAKRSPKKPYPRCMNQ